MNIESLVEAKKNPNIPTLTRGDTVRVSTKVVEGDKERTQVFQGVIIRVKHQGVGSTFTVRRVASGVGVERTFPLYSPRVEKVEVMRHGKTRRAKLYYLRGLSTKASRIKERRLTTQALEREREEARRLREMQEELLAPKQEEELVEEQEREEALVMEQEQEKAPALEQEETPIMEQEQEETTGPEQKQE